jgi:hypothetical protein
MIYDGSLLKINGTIIPAIVNYKVGRNKLWKNSDRNMAGDVRATLIGIFPKIELNIGVTSQEQMATLTEILDADFFEVEYFDVRVQGTTTASYYAGDYATEIQDKYRGLYKPFTVSLVPVSKRRY